MSIPVESGIVKRTLVARSAILDRFTEDVASHAGLDLLALEPLTTIIVRTRNSIYRFVTCGGTSVIVQGGRFFPDAIRARLDGSGFGGSLLKMAWIGVGFRMEIVGNGQRIITSPVREIAVETATPTTAH